ncbi:MAG: hypothetical protein ACYSTF_05410, partial [Planctomycetota bacterium]
DGAKTIRDLDHAKAKEPVSTKAIEKAFEPLEYRDVVPLLHETIISMLPNERHNREQTPLYKAFAAGDVDTIRQTKRKERKQIFVTGLSVRYAEDIGGVKFETTNLKSAAGKKKKDKEDEWDEEAEWERERRTRTRGGVGLPKYQKKMRWKKGMTGATTEEAEPGFLVTIAGYSPYGDLGELMDPAGVEDHRKLWGFVTRLRHLDQIIADSNSPFKLYDKAGLDHFKLEIKPVDASVEMPLGIGVEGNGRGTSNKEVLIDPLTKEVISRVAKLDDRGRPRLNSSGEVLYETNDYWFVLNVKFVWKDAPKKPAAGASDVSTARPVKRTSSKKKTRR